MKIGRLADIEREKRELETEPEKELEELTAIYEVCGLDQPLALQVAEARMKKYAFRGALAMVLTVRVGRFFFILFQIVLSASSGWNVFLTNVLKLLPEETFYPEALFLKVVVCDARQGRVRSGQSLESGCYPVFA